MDLRLYGRVLWRFRAIVAAGVALATLLALLSYVRVSFAGGTPKFSYRQSVTWMASEKLLVTQQGFPQGSTNGGDPAAFAGIANYYSFLANGDIVKKMVRHRLAGLRSSYEIDPVSMKSNGGSSLQPLLQTFGYAETPRAAARVASVSSAAFMSYLATKQAQAQIPASKRVVISVLNRPNAATIVVPRKKTLPIVVFIAALAAALALVLVLENLRPRIRAVEGQGRDQRDSIESRRSTA